MKKGQKPSKHYRNVKTKKGRRRVLINKNISKKYVLSKKSKGRINKGERKLFKHISDPNIYGFEWGGAIDFDLNGKIENINTIPGEEMEVELPPDYEVQYHTHPDFIDNPPTPEDIMALMSNKKQQAEIVWRNGQGFIIIKTPSSKALSKLPATKIYSILDKAFFSTEGKNWEKEYAKKLEQLGFIAYIQKDLDKAIDLKITPIEKIVKKKKLKKRINKWDL